MNQLKQLDNNDYTEYVNNCYIMNKEAISLVAWWMEANKINYEIAVFMEAIR